MFLATLLKFISLILFHQAGLNHISVGPSVPIFSIIYQYSRIMPAVYNFCIFGLPLNNKSMNYLLALQVCTLYSNQQFTSILKDSIACTEPFTWVSSCHCYQYNNETNISLWHSRIQYILPAAFHHSIFGMLHIASHWFTACTSLIKLHTSRWNKECWNLGGITSQWRSHYYH